MGSTFLDRSSETGARILDFEGFDERLKKLRKAKGYRNYEQFAYANDPNRVQYGRYEKVANISLQFFHKT